MSTTAIKQQLHHLCLAYVTQRIMNAQAAMEEAQRAANEETKSSAGDKYETGRAMMQLEKQKNALQLAEALKLKEQLAKVNPTKTYQEVQPGCLVKLNTGSFYIAISAGKLRLEGERYYAISIQSPIGQALRGKKQGEEIIFNGKKICVLAVV